MSVDIDRYLNNMSGMTPGDLASLRALFKDVIDTINTNNDVFDAHTHKFLGTASGSAVTTPPHSGTTPTNLGVSAVTFTDPGTTTS